MEKDDDLEQSGVTWWATEAV